jgi:glutathione S-transferase
MAGMISLYQLHWSHYVEKVRWALDFKGVEWEAVEVDPFSKREMRHLQCRTTLVPAIHDRTTGAMLGESSHIIEYLERTYPTPTLFAGDHMEVRRWMLWLDSTLGLAARRLAYTQIALENPGYLAGLFLPKLQGRNLQSRIAGSIIAGVLSRRFRFRHNRKDRVFEQLQECLAFAAQRLRSHGYLVGEQFTAADLTLAALMRPVTVVPYFTQQPELRSLFEWRRKQLQDHHRPALVGYETAMHQLRKRRGWTLDKVRWLPEAGNAAGLTGIPDLHAAQNDQQSVGRAPLLTGLFEYLMLKGMSRSARSEYRDVDVGADLET